MRQNLFGIHQLRWNFNFESWFIWMTFKSKQLEIVTEFVNYNPLIAVPTLIAMVDFVHWHEKSNWNISNSSYLKYFFVYFIFLIHNGMHSNLNHLNK
jgi:hypothetical protein